MFPVDPIGPFQSVPITNCFDQPPGIFKFNLKQGDIIAIFLLQKTKDGFLYRKNAYFLIRATHIYDFGKKR